MSAQAVDPPDEDPYDLPDLFSIQDEPWMQKGTCRVEKADPALFVLDKGKTTAEARKFCARCNYREQCLDYGLKSGSVGVWGGELLQLTHRDAVHLRPISMIERAFTIENLVNPKPLEPHQIPMFLFKNDPTSD